MRYRLTPKSMVLIKKKKKVTIPSAKRDAEELEVSYMAGGDAK